ncbi:MAG: alpha/beta hydrolase-fold protein [Planctomycetota bacterium]
MPMLAASLPAAFLFALSPAAASVLVFDEAADVPKGEIVEGTFQDSAIYPGTLRQYSVYVPAQYDPQTPAALMVFQDGHNFVREKGPFNVPGTFDRLIAEGKMPPTIAVMVDPGYSARQVQKDLNGVPPAGRGWQATVNGKRIKPGNRSIEYDTVTDDYVRYLQTELLPVALKGLNVSQDPELRAICGNSSGGICSFTAAWFTAGERGGFNKVVSHIGSYTGIRGGRGTGVPGGHEYPVMIRKTDPKPIRVALQDGSNDLSNEHGDWWLANQQMASALKYKDYDYKTWWGEGGHNSESASDRFEERLVWVWRDWKSSFPGA